MKKFRFSLSSVAMLRRLRENERRERFAAAVRAQSAAQEALDRVDARIGELQDLIARERTGLFRPAAQAAALQSLADEEVRKKEARTQVDQARTEAERERQTWLESRRDVRLIELLETKARGAHRLECEREEQALLDDRTNALAARAS